MEGGGNGVWPAVAEQQAAGSSWMIDDGKIGRRPRHLKAASGYRDAVQFLFLASPMKFQ